LLSVQSKIVTIQQQNIFTRRNNYGLDKTVFLTGLLSTLVMNSSPAAMAADWGRGDSCRRGDRLQIQDLDMSPDPVTDGQRIQAWKVRINFEGRRECDTEIYIREGNNVVGHARNYRLRPGVNEIEIPAAEAFRFKGRESCINIQAGSRRFPPAGRYQP
jgi:hypothetical protein